MPRFLSEEAHEAWCDAQGLPEDAVPEFIDEDEPTERVEYCLGCGRPVGADRACEPCGVER